MLHGCSHVHQMATYSLPVRSTGSSASGVDLVDLAVLNGNLTQLFCCHAQGISFNRRCLLTR